MKVPEPFLTKLRLLANAIREIDSAIAARKELNRRIRAQINREIRELQAYLATLQPPWKAGYLPQYEFMRISLHRSLTNRHRNQRQEEVRLWEHLNNLLKERRKLIMEYRELLATLRSAAGGDEED